MIILNGPRQVGKTTLSKTFRKKQDNFIYLNWDIKEDRQQILQGQRSLAKHIGLEGLKNSVIVFDELHKYAKWKSYLKGFYDAYQHKCHILVTGSQKLIIKQNCTFRSIRQPIPVVFANRFHFYSPMHSGVFAKHYSIILF